MNSPLGEPQDELRRQIAENESLIARLNAELAKKTSDVRIIQRISAEITSTLELDTILEIVLGAMDRTLGFRYSMILLQEARAQPPGQFLKVVASRGYEASGLGAEVPVGQGVIGMVAERGRMMRIGNLGASMMYMTSVRAGMEKAGQLAPGHAPAKPPGLAGAQSQLAMPLLIKQRVIGVLAVESPEPNAFDELDEALLSIVASQSATAIENARAYRKIEQLGRLKRFFSPQLAELIVDGGTEDPLRTHRREITVVFLDLRGFTAFAESFEPEEVMAVLRDYHAEMGKLILEYEGTLERFTGDGMMIFFNDPVVVADAAARAVKMALAMRERVKMLSAKWRKRGYELDFGVGIAQGYATIGAIGFEGRWDYGAIGSVTNLAARLCGEAKPGEILVSLRVAGETEDVVAAVEGEPLTLKGFARPVPVFRVAALKPG